MLPLLVFLTLAWIPSALSRRCNSATTHHLSPTSGYNGTIFRPIAPKVVIISMFSPEAETWYGHPGLNLLAQNITLPGLSPLFPYIHCSDNYDICQIIVGEGEINAAASMSALILSHCFQLDKTYFMVAGIAGVNPLQGTTADVMFSRFAVQVGLQYEIDAREMPVNFSTGYFPQGSSSPGQYPQAIYGTEVFEVNDALRKLAVGFAKNATLNDTKVAQAYRAKYPLGSLAQNAPSVRECDSITTDVFFTGALLGDAFANFTKLMTNGLGVYCATEQEDNATLEVLLRGATSKLIDFGRIILMRTASDFDRPYPTESVLQNLLYEDSGAFESSIANIYLAGIKVVEGIVSNWENIFEKGVEPQNYIGDILGTLGGTPNSGSVDSTQGLRRR